MSSLTRLLSGAIDAVAYVGRLALALGVYAAILAALLYRLREEAGSDDSEQRDLRYFDDSE